MNELIRLILNCVYIETRLMVVFLCQSGAAGWVKGFVACFLEVPLACFGSMATAVQPNMLQNLFLSLPPQTVIKCANFTSDMHIVIMPRFAEPLCRQSDWYFPVWNTSDKYGEICIIPASTGRSKWILTLEMEVFYMLFERCHIKNRKRSIKQHIKYINFRS